LGLGNTRLVQGDTTGSLAAYRAGRALVEARRGADSPEAALVLVMEGQVLAARGVFDSAFVALERSLAIRRRVLGEAHVQTALSHFGLGEAWRGRGDLARAAASLDTALAVFERAGAAGDPTAVEARTARARTHLAAGEDAAALSAALRADSIVRANVSRHAPALEDRLALAYSGAQMRPLDVALSLLARGAGRARIADVWDALVGGRTLILDEMAARRHAVATGGDVALRALADSLAVARSALARLALRGAADSAAALARRRVDPLEVAIAERSAAFRAGLDARRAGLDRVRAALEGGDALVAYVRFARDTGTTAVRDVYGAFSCAGPTGQPRWTLLGSAAPIDAAIAAWRAEASRPPNPLRPTHDEARVRETGARVRRAVWAALPAEVHMAKRVFVVPAADLHGVDLAALPVGSREYLVERGSLLHRLTSERDLLGAPEPSSAGGLLAMGGADYDAANRGELLAVAPAAHATFRGARSTCPDLRTLRFAPLPGTRAEAAAVAADWERRGANGVATVRLGADASEARLAADAPGHRVLHLATHGFFVARTCGARAGAPPENPLLRSGLALAGANRRDQAAPGAEDGVLTAEEAGSLPLEGTEWVVLSACESGLGDAHDAEGVLGLQRAFRIAGARTVIASLWPVGDETTRRWMTALYGARLAGHATAEAVRRASLELLRARRAQGLNTHPRHWAGFVAAGDWR
jgi:CHAT domain-containing protein/tetratricopeptide (TPR) repeat protein